MKEVAPVDPSARQTSFGGGIYDGSASQRKSFWLGRSAQALSRIFLDNRYRELTMPQSAEFRENGEAATDSFENVIDDFRELTTKFNDLVSSGSASVDQLRDLRDEARVKITEARSLVRDAAEEARYGTVQAIRHAAAASNDYVHRNPWATVSVAGSIGLLFGLLVSRRIS